MLEYCVAYKKITTVGELVKALKALDQNLPLHIRTNTGEGEDCGDFFDGINFAVGKEKEENSAMLLIEAKRPEQREYSVYFAGEEFMVVASSYDEAYDQISEQFFAEEEDENESGRTDPGRTSP